MAVLQSIYLTRPNTCPFQCGPYLRICPLLQSNLRSGRNRLFRLVRHNTPYCILKRNFLCSLRKNINWIRGHTLARIESIMVGKCYVPNDVVHVVASYPSTIVIRIASVSFSVVFGIGLIYVSVIIGSASCFHAVPRIFCASPKMMKRLKTRRKRSKGL